MKTKFVKISVQERLPEKEGKYICKILGRERHLTQIFRNEQAFIEHWNSVVEYYLIEVPDREEELAGILQEAINLIDELPYDEKLQETRGNLCMNAQSLIFDVKKNAPDLLDPR